MMFAVIETATNKVVHLLGDEPVITDDGMMSPIKALDVKTATHEVVEADVPPFAFVPGLVTLAAGEWAIVDEYAHGKAIEPSQAMLEAERDRRLALGFIHDFGDERGKHFISTTEADNNKWREVTDIANAAINAGIPTTQIGMKTGTGQVLITAAEWQMVLLHAGQVRQPIYQAYFTLNAMDPRPADFTNDGYWV